MWTLAIIVKINFYRTLEINQKLAIICWAFIQEKWLNLNKNIKLCDILNCHISSPLSQTSCRAWKPTTPKSGSPWPDYHCVCAFPKALFPEICHYLTCLAGPWRINSWEKPPLTGLVFFWPRVLSLWIAFSTGYFWKTTSDSHLASELPEAVITVGTNKKVTKTLTRRNGGLRYPSWAVWGSDIFLEYRRPYACAGLCAHSGKTSKALTWPLANLGALYKKEMKAKARLPIAWQSIEGIPPIYTKSPSASWRLIGSRNLRKSQSNY